MYPILQLIISCFLFSILAALIKFNANFIHPTEQAFLEIFQYFFALTFFFETKSNR